MQQSKRRLAAISFLSNISLDGTYKDSGKSGDVVKDGVLQVLSGNGNGGPGPGDCSSQSILMQLQQHELVTASYHRTAGNGHDYYGFNDSKTCSRGGSISIDEELFINVNQLARKRMNTGLSESSRRQDVPFGGNSSGRRTHFSSSESIENGTAAKGPNNNLSTTNISESSLERPREVKIINMADVNPNKLSISFERLIITVSRRSPWLIYSVLPYQNKRNPRLNRQLDRLEGSRRVRNTSGSRPVLTHIIDPDPLEQLFHKDSEEVSYSNLIQATVDTESNQEDGFFFIKAPTSYAMARCFSTESGARSYLANSSTTPPEYNSEFQENSSRYRELKSIGGKYSAHILDDSEFLAGKHRTLLTFASYITSVIEYCKASDLKKELNDKFRDRFPTVQLTLSKLRSLKREMRKLARTECNIDLLVVAQAYVYFEKLILKSYVTKSNRKFCCGACLLLSAKLNDVKGQHLYNLIEVIERSFRVNRKELFKYEFAALIGLEFALHIPGWEVLPHYQRLLYES